MTIAEIRRLPGATAGVPIAIALLLGVLLVSGGSSAPAPSYGTPKPGTSIPDVPWATPHRSTIPVASPSPRERSTPSASPSPSPSVPAVIKWDGDAPVDGRCDSDRRDFTKPLIVGSWNVEWYGAWQQTGRGNKRNRHSDADDRALADELAVFVARCDVVVLQEVTLSKRTGKLIDEALPEVEGYARYIAPMSPYMQRTEYEEQQVCAVYAKTALKPLFGHVTDAAIPDAKQANRGWTRLPVVVAFATGEVVVGVHLKSPSGTRGTENWKRELRALAALDFADVIVGDFNWRMDKEPPWPDGWTHRWWRTDFGASLDRLVVRAGLAAPIPEVTKETRCDHDPALAAVTRK